MIHRIWLAAGLMMTLGLCGCGGGTAPTTEAGEKPAIEAEGAVQASSEKPTSSDAAAGPKEALGRFLTAVKAGDDEGAAAMLTTLARQKTTEKGLTVAPPGSDTATFKVSQVEMKGDSGAYVACQWTETDGQGAKTTDEVVWVMSREESGWRIAGMVVKVFPDLDAIVFNFEDPDEMERKQQMAQQEMERRAAAAAKVLGADSVVDNEADAAKTHSADDGTATSAGRPRR